MAEFTFQELAEASGGVLLNTDGRGSVNSVSTDTREDLRGALFLAIRGEKFDGHAFLDKAVEKGAALVCIEKSRAASLPGTVPALAVDDTLRAYQKIAAYHRKRFPSLRLIALTGSCGKTSTKEMIRSILEEAYGKEHVLATEANFNNQIGVPRTLLNLNKNHRAAVIEMGTNHFGEIAPLAETAAPDTALIVSIAHCHLEFFGDLEGVAKEKSDIYRFLPACGNAVIPEDAAGTDIMRMKAGKRTILYFGNGPRSRMSTVYHRGDLTGSCFSLTDHQTGRTAEVHWGLTGPHQAANAAGAAAAAISEGIDLDTIARGLANCTLPGLRMKQSAHDNALWINDAYNANSDSMAAGLRSLAEIAKGKELLLVLGDMLETGPEEHRLHCSTLSLAREIFPGAAIAAVGPRMTRAADELSLPGTIRCFPDSVSCAKEIASMIPAGGIVFLKASHGIRLDKVEAFHEIG